MAKGDSGLNKAMKSVGRNMARANLQKASKQAPAKYADGGGVTYPKSASMGAVGTSGAIDGSGSGAMDKARGGQATRGRRFSGTF